MFLLAKENNVFGVDKPKCLSHTEFDNKVPYQKIIIQVRLFLSVPAFIALSVEVVFMIEDS